MKYKKANNKDFKLIGYVETLNGVNDSVVIAELDRHDKRDATTIFMTIDQVKQFIPFLYKPVDIDYINGQFSINHLVKTIS